VFKANLDAGHGGIYFTKNGGKFGRAVVAFLEWQFRNDLKSKQIYTQPSFSGILESDKWEVEFKGWN
jgi:hypothetical protein